MINVLYKTIFAPLEVFSRQDKKGRLGASVTIVISTIILGSVIAPVLYFYASKDRYVISLNAESLILRTALSIATWLFVCAVFWLLSKAFKKDLSYKNIAAAWGLTYIPNLLTVVLYTILMVFPEINSGNILAAFIICTLFIMFLVWKAILYFMIMRFVIDTTPREIVIYTIVSAAVFTALIVIEFSVGIQVPML
ncbi:MAG: YIP1 family protein [Clostridia bacterium]|nr:YIP1 family protein [Clostridia bacterium]